MLRLEIIFFVFLNIKNQKVVKMKNKLKGTHFGIL